MGFKELFTEALNKGATERTLIELKAGYNKLTPNSKKIVINKLNELIRQGKPNLISTVIYKTLDVLKFYEEIEKMINDKSEELCQNAIEKCVWLNTESSIKILSRRYETGSDTIKHMIVKHCIDKNCEQAVELIIKYFPKLTSDEKALFLSNLPKYGLKRDLISSFLLDLLTQKIYLNYVFDFMPIYADSTTVEALLVKLFSNFGIFQESILKILRIVDYQSFGNKSLDEIFNELPDSIKKKIEIALFHEVLDNFDNHVEIQMFLQTKFKKYSGIKSLPKIIVNMIETIPDLEKKKIFDFMNSVRTEKAIFAASILSELSGLGSHQAIVAVLKNNYRSIDLKKSIVLNIEIPNRADLYNLYFDVLIEFLNKHDLNDSENELNNLFVLLYDKLVGYYSERFLTFIENNTDNFEIRIKKRLIQYIIRYSAHSDIEKIIELLRSEEKTIIDSTLKDLAISNLTENQLIALFRYFPEYNRRYQEKIFNVLKAHLPNKLSEELCDQLFILASCVLPDVMVDALGVLSNAIHEKINSEDISSIYSLISKYIASRPNIKEEFESALELNIKKIVESGIRMKKMYLDLYFKFPFSHKYFMAYIETTQRNEAINILKNSSSHKKTITTKQMFYSLDKKIQHWITLTLIGHLQNTSPNMITMSTKIDILNLFIEMDDNIILFEIMNIFDMYKSEEWFDTILKVIESIRSSMSLEILLSIIKKLLGNESNVDNASKIIPVILKYSKYWGYYWAFEILYREELNKNALFSSLQGKHQSEYLIAFHDFFKNNQNKQMNIKLLFFMNKLIQFGISVDGLRLLPKYNPKEYIKLFLEDSPYSKEIVLFLENSEIDCSQFITSFIQSETNENNKMKLLNLSERIKRRNVQSTPTSDIIL